MREELRKTAELYKEVREMLGESQGVFAERFETTQGNICHIEQGLRDPKGYHVIEVLELKRKALIKLANL